MIRHGKGLPNQIFGSVMGDLNQLATIVQGGRALAYSVGNIDSEFRSRFPGYGYTAGAYYRDYRVWSQTTLDTTLSTLRAAGLQGQQLQSEQSVLAALRTMAMSADGRMQALQVGNQISEQTVEQLMKLRQLMLADLQSKQAFQAAQMQNEARGHAATEQFFNYASPARDGRTFGGGSR
jgi:type IV secretion system protein TrbJ